MKITGLSLNRRSKRASTRSASSAIDFRDSSLISGHNLCIKISESDNPADCSNKYAYFLYQSRDIVGTYLDFKRMSWRVVTSKFFQAVLILADPWVHACFTLSTALCIWIFLEISSTSLGYRICLPWDHQSETGSGRDRVHVRDHENDRDRGRDCGRGHDRGRDYGRDHRHGSSFHHGSEHESSLICFLTCFFCFVSVLVSFVFSQAFHWKMRENGTQKYKMLFFILSTSESLGEISEAIFREAKASSNCPNSKRAVAFL